MSLILGAPSRARRLKTTIEKLVITVSYWRLRNRLLRLTEGYQTFFAQNSINLVAISTSLWA